MTDKLIEFLLAEARPRILKVARRDSCIFSTRVAVGVLRRFGIQARALPVTVCVFNPPLVKHLEDYLLSSPAAMRPEQIMHLLRDWQFDETTGCYAVGIGFGHPEGKPPPPGGGFDAHLVAAVEDRILLDLSIDQVNRPERAIVLQPLSLTVELSALATLERQAQALAFRAPGGCMIRYGRRVNDDYLRSKDWNVHERSRPLIDELVMLFKQREGIHA